MTGTFELPEASTVTCAKRCGDYFVAIIRKQSHIFLLRGDWNGKLQQTEWPLDDASTEVIVPALDEQLSRPERILFSGSISGTASERLLQPTRHFPGPLHFFDPPWLPRVLATSVSAGQYWMLRFVESDLIAEARGESGQIIGNFKLPDELHQMAREVIQSRPARGGISMLAMRSNLWIAVRRKLYCFSGNSTWKEWNFEGEIFGLEQSSPFLSRAIAVRCSTGAAVFWADHISATPEIISSKLIAPLAAFLRNGSLVLLSTSAGPEGFPGQVIDLDRRGIHSTADFTWKGDWPAALVATDQPGGFAIFTKYGAVVKFAG
jgi:hypothetical protein